MRYFSLAARSAQSAAWASPLSISLRMPAMGKPISAAIASCQLRSAMSCRSRKKRVDIATPALQTGSCRQTVSRVLRILHRTFPQAGRPLETGGNSPTWAACFGPRYPGGCRHDQNVPPPVSRSAHNLQLPPGRPTLRQYARQHHRTGGESDTAR